MPKIACIMYASFGSFFSFKYFVQYWHTMSIFSRNVTFFSLSFSLSVCVCVFVCVRVSLSFLFLYVSACLSFLSLSVCLSVCLIFSSPLITLSPNLKLSFTIHSPNSHCNYLPLVFLPFSYIQTLSTLPLSQHSPSPSSDLFLSFNF